VSHPVRIVKTLRAAYARRNNPSMLPSRPARFLDPGNQQREQQRQHTMPD